MPAPLLKRSGELSKLREVFEQEFGGGALAALQRGSGNKKLLNKKLEAASANSILNKK